MPEIRGQSIPTPSLTDEEVKRALEAQKWEVRRSHAASHLLRAKYPNARTVSDDEYTEALKVVDAFCNRRPGPERAPNLPPGKRRA